MVGQHHQLNGHELVQTLADSEGQGGLVWYSPWGCKESDMSLWSEQTQQMIVVECCVGFCHVAT